MYMLTGPSPVDGMKGPQPLTNWSEAAFAGKAMKSPGQTAKRKQTSVSFLFMSEDRRITGY
jgi:hypothetical protein